MEVLFAIVAIFMLGYIGGTTVTNCRRTAEASENPPRRHCKTCNYCFAISATTKSLMHKAYADKSGCLMCRGSTVPVGYRGATISVVGEDSFCDQWKERVPDG